MTLRMKRPGAKLNSAGSQGLRPLGHHSNGVNEMPAYTVTITYKTSNGRGFDATVNSVEERGFSSRHAARAWIAGVGDMALESEHVADVDVISRDAITVYDALNGGFQEFRVVKNKQQ